MKKLGFILCILFTQITKNFSQESKINAEFYLKFNNHFKIENFDIKPLLNKYLENYNISVKSANKAFTNNFIGNFNDYYRINLEVDRDFQIEKILSSIDIVEKYERVIEYKFYHQPNDPKFSYQDTMWHLYKINAMGAWDLSRGNDSVTIAVVDDNFEISHPDLQSNIYNNINETPNDGIDNDSNGIIDDINGADLSNNTGNPYTADALFGHGTKVAGCVSASTNNGIGISSIGYSCKNLPVKCTNNAAFVSHGLEALHYAASMPNVKVVNISWGENTYSQLMQEIIDSAMFYKNNQIVFVAAAGNTNDSLKTYPAACNNVIAVSATDKFDNKLSSAKYGNWVDIAAPGISIYTTKINAKYGRFTDDGIYLITGTSFSSPIVAGTVGLMFSVNQNLTYNEILDCLTSTSDIANPLNANCNCPIGGRLNAYAAMQCICSTNTCWLNNLELNDKEIKFVSTVFDKNIFINTRYSGLYEVNIINLLGKKVFAKPKSNIKNIDVSNLHAGIYIVQITADGKSYNQKIVVK